MNIYQADFNFSTKNPFILETLTLNRSDNADSDFHWHSCIEITLIKRGNGIYNVKEKTFSVSQGDFVIFNPMEAHGWEVLSAQMEVIVILFPTELSTNLIDSSHNKVITDFMIYGVSFYNKIEKSSEHYPEFLETFHSILVEDQTRKIGYDLIIKSDILKLFIHLIRYFKASPDSPENYRNRESGMLRLKKVFQYLYSNYNEKITLQQMASLCYMTPSYFSSYFHQTMDCTFTRYLNGIRVQQAQKLLYTTEKSILDIANECGFPNLSNFYRTYKDYTGFSPGKERTRIEDSTA